MVKRLEGIKVVEVGGAAAMPLAGMLMGSWGADVIHVEPSVSGDAIRNSVAQGMAGWGRPHQINYLWEHLNRNKKSIAIDLGCKEGQGIIHKLITTTDVFLNNLRPYEMDKFSLTYSTLQKLNSKVVYGNLTGYGKRGPEMNTGGYDSVAFWARSGIMDLMHEGDTSPNISRYGYGDSVTSLCFLAGIMTALFIRERTGVGQEVEVSLFNTGTWVLGIDIAGSLITGEDSLRPSRKVMANPLRNVYQTSDKRWIMLGMTNAQHYWPTFCKAIGYPELEKHQNFATYDARAQHAEDLVEKIERIFLTKPHSEWIRILSEYRLIWSLVKTPLEVTRDEQAIANDFFMEWDHPDYGGIKVLNNPIKLSKTPSEIKDKAPKLGEHTGQILKELGYSEIDITKMKKSGIIR